MMTWTIIATLGGFTGLLLGVQTTWIIHSLGGISERLNRMDARAEARFKQEDKRFHGVDARFERMQERMDERFDRLEQLLTNHGERITRLEERAQQ